MKYFQNLLLAILSLVIMAGLNSCQDAKGDQTGSEFIPDMAHSVAYEANVYGNYSFHSFEDESTFGRKELSNVRLPVKGTIPRGYAGNTLNVEHITNERAIKIPANGTVPYYYGNTEEERTRATEEVIENPFPITENGLKEGKELYNVYCGICHGPKGDGLGWIVRDDGGKYPAAPANFLLDDFINSTNGRYYHAIMYGKNVMQSHADKLSFEERWQVIHYIRSLQAKEKKLMYNEEENTLNNWATPYADIKAVMPEVTEAQPTEEVPDASGQGQQDTH